MNNKEKFKTWWKKYGPIMAGATVTVACIIVANKIGQRSATRKINDACQDAFGLSIEDVIKWAKTGRSGEYGHVLFDACGADGCNLSIDSFGEYSKRFTDILKSFGKDPNKIKDITNVVLVMSVDN